MFSNARTDTVIKTLLIFGVCAVSLVSGWLVARGAFNQLVIGLIGVVILALTLIRPYFPMVVYYPFVWIYWAYIIVSIPLIGGRVERLVGFLGLAGLLLILQKQRSRLLQLPPLVVIGSAILVFSYLLSWVTHAWLPYAGDTIVSLIARLIFLYLAFIHIQTRQQLRLFIVLLCVAATFAALLTLLASVLYGFGFARIPAQLDAFRQSFGPLGYLPVASATLGTAPALLLVCLFPNLKKNSQRLVLVAWVMFLFWMAFASQYRREILITVPIALLSLVLDRGAGVRRPALSMLLVAVVFFFLIVLPTDVLQTRLQNETSAVLTGSEARLVSARVGLQAFFANPLIGYGPGAYHITAATILGGGEEARFEENPYNVFIWVAVESGVFGLLGLGLILLGVFIEALRSRSTAQDVEGWVSRSAPVLLVQIVIWFSFGNAYELSQPWFLMGMILAAARITQQNATLPNEDR
jgi:hypothetical protein